MSEKEDEALLEDVRTLQKAFEKIRAELRKLLVGQDNIVTFLLESLVSKGHVLVEGVPGTGKTLILRLISTVTGCQFSRIQFTPDLLPTDILGLTTYEEGKGFYTVKGPVFANFVLADEINRSPPKVQSALLEAMQEYQVTIGKETFFLPSPFFVMATQNPLEQVGTYKLPEAQIDRFLYKIFIDYPNIEDEQKILRSNMTTRKFEDFDLKAIISPDNIIHAQSVLAKIRLNSKVEKYIVRVVDATRNPDKYNISKGKYIGYGGSPRSSIGLYIAAKAHAMVDGRIYATPNDVKAIAHNVLRHRIILNFEGEAENINTNDIIDEILKKVPII
ncbi:MAG: MoxR family ATPase [Nanoarchaeota archaeon]|nr:MoxR family ATPase [Nanoarchaeota archaeon]